MTADELATDVLRRARFGNRRAHVPALPADQLAAIFASPAPGSQSVDGWTLPDDQELDEVLEG